VFTSAVVVKESQYVGKQILCWLRVKTKDVKEDSEGGKGKRMERNKSITKRGGWTTVQL